MEFTKLQSPTSLCQMTLSNLPAHFPYSPVEYGASQNYRVSQVLLKMGHGSIFMMGTLKKVFERGL